MSCPLCHSSKTKKLIFVKEVQYEVCEDCLTVYMSSEFFLTRDDEKKRYDLHNNCEEDQRYLDYMTFNKEKCLELCGQNLAKGCTSLDFGCGATNIMSDLMKAEGFNSHSFDPLYFPIELEQSSYDLITAIEVVEHFYEPAREWERLFSILNPTGALVIRTQRVTEVADFGNWWYKNDPTHVTFYHDRGLEWLAQKYNKQLRIDDNFIAFI